MTGSPQALDGVRVLDFTQMMLGPLCTQTLADLGADVIKVERPGAGEWMRSMPMLGEFVGKDSAAFHAFNCNKRSIAVDLKNPDGRALLLEIAKQFDVVTENFRDRDAIKRRIYLENYGKGNSTAGDFRAAMCCR